MPLVAEAIIMRPLGDIVLGSHGNGELITTFPNMEVLLARIGESRYILVSWLSVNVRK